MKKEAFITEVSKKILAEKCDLFVGSGISSGSKLTSWFDLLRPLAMDLDITLDDYDDLPMIAQYIVNNNGGNKNVIYNLIVDNYGKDYPLNMYHDVISDITINTVWTTNYDLLLEKCFAARKPRIITRNSDLSKPSYKREFEIIKLHGSADGEMDDIVLTQQEYDALLYKKPAIAQRLRDSFIQKSFLFIGYNYRDPDIRHLMIEATKQSNDFSQDHYIILRKPYKTPTESDEHFERNKKRFYLWVKELNRIGIRELLIDNYDELQEVLAKISLLSRGRSVFVSGSHANNDVLYENYGKRLAKLKNIIMINGQNQGVGINVVNGFMEEAVNEKKELADIIKFFPNPYAANPKFANEKRLLPQLKEARIPLFLSAKLFVVFAGGMGTEAEIEVAKDKGCDILIAISDRKDYRNPFIKSLLSDDYCKKSMSKASDYYNKITSNIVPSIDDLVQATEVMLND